MPDPMGALRKYTLEVANWLRGEGPPTHLPQQPSPHPVPIYLAALTSQNVELAGEIADGVMPLWWSVERVARSRRWIERGRGKSGGRGKLELTLGLPTYVGDDIDALRAAAACQSRIFHRVAVLSAFDTCEWLHRRGQQGGGRVWRAEALERSPARRDLPARSRRALPRPARRISRGRPRSADPVAGDGSRQRPASHRRIRAVIGCRIRALRRGRWQPMLHRTI